MNTYNIVKAEQVAGSLTVYITVGKGEDELTQPIQVGIIGLGFMGATHYKALQDVRGARVAALSTRNRARLHGDWRDIRGNFGTAGGNVDLTAVLRYENYEDLLAEPNLDLISVCLPTSLHRTVAEQALAAGKHVLVEKPIAATTADARAMIATAKRAGRHLFVGHVLRFYPEYELLHRYVRSGKLGRLKALHMKRVISKSDELSGLAHRGGAVLDLHIHDADFVNLLLGMPEKVYAAGLSAHGYPTHVTATYTYDDPVSVSLVTGYAAVPAVSFEQGYAAYFEYGTLQYNSLHQPRPVLWHRHNGKMESPDLQIHDPFQAELQYVVDACAGLHAGQLLAATEGCNALRLVEAITKSMITGEPEMVGRNPQLGV